MIRDGRRLHRTVESLPASKRHFISPMVTAGAEFLGALPDAAQSISNILSPAITGAGVGALTAGLTGGKPLTGALVGGGVGALGGATGVTGALGNALGLTDVGNSIASGLGISGTMSPSDLLDASGNPIVPPIPTVDANGNPIPAAASDAATGAGTTLAATSAADAGTKAGGAGGLFGGGKGISGTALALGALAALGSAFAKPKQWATPTQVAASLPQNTSPTFNTPINTNVPGRTPVTPQNVNWYTYGQIPEQQFFSGNSLANFGFARGGALAHGREFATHGVSRRVSGPGTGTSDDVPARLSDGEYVLTARDVERIGDGSNERGAAILDHDRGALAKALGEKKFTGQKLKKRKPERAAA